jgi:hypothetical protein
MIIAIASGILDIALAVVLWRNLRKIERYEDYVVELENSILQYDMFLLAQRRKVRNAYDRMSQLDRLGSFQSDDETGYIFEEIKSVATELNTDFEWLDNETQTNTTSPKTPKTR